MMSTKGTVQLQEPGVTPDWKGEAAENEKAAAGGPSRTCAEEDSNLHPVIPDQALNLARRVLDASGSCRSVQIVQRGSTVWTEWTMWMLSRLLSRRGDAVAAGDVGVGGGRDDSAQRRGLEPEARRADMLCSVLGRGRVGRRSRSGVER